MLYYSSVSIFVLLVSFALGIGWPIPSAVIGMWLRRAFSPWIQGGTYDLNYVNQQIYSRWGIVFGVLIGVLLEIRRRRKIRNELDEVTK